MRLRMCSETSVCFHGTLSSEETWKRRQEWHRPSWLHAIISMTFCPRHFKRFSRVKEIRKDNCKYGLTVVAVQKQRRWLGSGRHVLRSGC
mmetsp:Transcript_65306/g.142419  ORF Transcript_65306/g.142419 Transcript_65306/m.142419 type:complete len:90 (-) Transcript_65306:806-1075(-)